MKRAGDCESQTEIEREAWKSYLSEGNPVDHHIVKALLDHVCCCDFCGKREGESAKFNAKDVLKGSKMTIPKETLGKLDPRLVEERKPSKHILELRARAQNREYERMVQDLSHEKMTLKGFLGFGGLTEEEKREMTDNIYVPINIVITMFTCFIVGFFLGYHAMGGKEGGLILGALFLIGAVLVEAVLAVIRLSRQENEKERFEKEQMKAHDVGVFDTSLSSYGKEKDQDRVTEIKLLPLQKKND